MAEILDQVAEKIKGVSSSWTAYSAMGAFVLYFLGYLIVRFHLMVLGVGAGADLYVFDERYLFAGANFLVDLISRFSKLILLVMLLALIFGAPAYLLSRLLPVSWRERLWQWLKQLGSWWANPVRLGITGIVLSVLMIQIFLTKAFLFSSILLGEKTFPLDPLLPFFKSLLWSDNPVPLQLYYSGLVAVTLLMWGVLMALLHRPLPDRLPKFLRDLLAILLIVQFCMLPINYGVFIFEKYLPRLAGYGPVRKIDSGTRVWLVWEGKENCTFFQKSKGAGSLAKASLITLPHKEIKEIEIVGYDPISRVLQDVK